MIIYLTKQTSKRFGIKPEARESALQGDRLHEWGAKIFYLEGRKCLQLVNFAGKITLLWSDVKKSDLAGVQDYIEFMLMNIYIGDEEMTDTLQRMFAESPFEGFGRLTDRSAVATLNRTQMDHIDRGLYRYIDEGVLLERQVNYRLNFECFVTFTENGRTEYEYPAARFRELLLERYGER